jgi:formylglycine-generating enzyme required for sulfatase activity
MTDCGAARECCCKSLDLPGGTFYRTYSNSGSGPKDEGDPATVSSFRLDKYEVTVGRFRQFVNAWNQGWRPRLGSGKHAYLNGGQGLVNSATPGANEIGWSAPYESQVMLTSADLQCGQGFAFQAWTDMPGPQENMPMDCTSWEDAYAFCIWDDAFLPSEAEWEYAAAAGTQQREYPWGATPPGTSNQYAIYGCYYPDPQWSIGGGCEPVATEASVGTATRGAGLWGQLDLAGNVMEWVLDYEEMPYANPCVDCAFMTSPGLISNGHVVRGGGWGLPSTYLPSVTRATGPFAAAAGIRCARTPQG